MASGIVREVWRRLPVGFRRPLAHGLLTKFAPRLGPAPNVPDNAPWIVVGFLSSPSGLGQSARLAMRALEAMGRAVYGVDLSRNFFETADRVPLAYRDGRLVRGPAHVLVNINAPYMKYAFQLLGGGFLREKHVIAYWAWELSRAPDSWRDGLTRAHRVAVPSQFVADAVAALGAASIVVAPHPVALEPAPAIERRTAAVSAAAPFTVVSALSVASGFERKNPLALIAAFKKAFASAPEKRLRVLISGAEHYAPARHAIEAATQGAANIELTFGAFDRDTYWRWYGAPDLYASLHRAEGFGLPLAESMCAGVPVLATNWSANAEYMTERNSLPVHYRLIAVADAQQKYDADGQLWADADVEHAAALMQRAAGDSAWLGALAAQGQRDARSRFSTFPV